jgi:hypothetical protein
MQYVNGFDISAQGISEVITINEKVNLPKASEKDGVTLYEKISGKRTKKKKKGDINNNNHSEFHYIGKSQSIINVPAEYAYTQVRNSDYSFFPGCVEHRTIERYPTKYTI